MSHPPRDTESPSTDGDEESSTTLDDPLDEIKQRAATESETLEELGFYSVHDRETSRLLTLPVEAEGFDDVAKVKQFYIDDGEQPMLVVLPTA
jgi:hypothetical protein